MSKVSTPTQSNGHSAPSWELCDRITTLLGLGTVERYVTGAEIFGSGPAARTRIYLRDETTGKQARPITVERFGELAQPSALATLLVTWTGVYRTFKSPDAGAVAAAIFRLAQHHDNVEREQEASEWGSEFLRIAALEQVDMKDQAARWEAFGKLARLQPARDAGEDRSAYAIAAASVVLLDAKTDHRLVRTGWFKAYVKREAMPIPHDLGQLMESVGWERPGGRGKVKATCPTDGRQLAWSFYSVPPGWESAVYASVPS
jgi:hypothetical protein